MSADSPLRVVLCWHMHQPQYQEMASGEFQLPWTYLHAVKDYVDMAALLEENPQARAVVNFAPILLEQLETYSTAIQAFLNEDKTIPDPLLAALAGAVLPDEAEARLRLINQCLRANAERLIARYPAYQRLADIAAQAEKTPHLAAYLDSRYLTDLLVWYHLAWLGETVQRGDARVAALLRKEQHYSLHDRRELLTIYGELIATLIPRYRRLAEQGRVELSMNPYAHPIVPLLLDVHSARDAVPDITLPRHTAYPGGAERARWHFREGLALFERCFGLRPRGCWPSEGALSDATVEMMSEFGFAWTASGEGVLRNSLTRAGREAEISSHQALHRPYRLPAADTAMFFRDDGLSDLIGFSYSSWHGDDAAADLVRHLLGIADACVAAGADLERHVVPIILDGENAWEHFPNNGYYFLSALYRGLVAEPRLALTTFSECLSAETSPAALDGLVAGSWVYGSFSTWIGDADKNHAWDLLVEAKQDYDRVMAESHLSPARREAAARQLAICEGSDWFWWFGDYNPAEAVADFERLYRYHLVHLYGLLGLEPPPILSQVLAHGGGVPEHGGAMRRGRDVA